jgi:AraC-like DNA-binding protein
LPAGGSRCPAWHLQPDRAGRELHTGRATCEDGWIYRNFHIEAPLMVRLLQSIEWRRSMDASFKSSLVKDTVLAAWLARVFASMTGAALSEVAYRTGFCDQSHLTRCFKRTLGVTPGSYATCHAE